MTNEERTSIVEQILTIIRINCRSIEQLTPVSVVGDSDMFEISGGRRVAFADMAEQIADLLGESEVISDINANIQQVVEAIGRLESNKLDRAKMVVLTQAEYDAIAVKDPDTYYFIPE